MGPHSRATSRDGTSVRSPSRVSQSRASLHEPQPGLSFDRERNVEVVTLNNAQPRAWHSDFSTVPRKVWRQLLGLNPFRTSYFSLFRPLRTAESRLTLGAACLLAVAAGVPLPVIGVIFGKIIDSFPPNEDELRVRLSQLLGVAAGYFAVTTGYTIAWSLTGERISRGLRESLVDRLLGLDQAYFDVHDPDVTNLLTDKIEVIQIGTSEKCGIFIQSISYFVAAFVVGFILNAELTGILFAAVIPVMTFIVVFGSHWVSKFSKKASEYTEHAGRLAEGAITSVKVVQAFDMSSTLSKEHYRLLCMSARFALRKSVAGAMMLGAVYLTAYSANALAFYVGSRLASEAGIEGAGTVYAVVFLILDAAFVVGQFGPFVGAFASAAAAGEKVYDVLNRENPDIDIYSDKGKPMDGSAFRKDITFRGVSFVYPSRTATRALDELNVVLKGGVMNAIIGSSGCGKSTFVSLLLRLYDVTSGKIMVDGYDIRDYNVAALRANVALVDQESVTFSGSILDNIRHGLGEHDLPEQEVHDRCLQAAKDANVNFIEQLPHGINTLIGDGGETSLSGGQRQRICLARALVKRPSLLLLDEPTSALDATSEMLVLDAVKKVAARGTTVVMVAHRLSTVLDASKIILMGSGKVVEQGTHEELVQLNGAYQGMIQAQCVGLSHLDDDIVLEKTTSVDYTSTSSSVTSSTVDGEHGDGKIVKPKPMGITQILRRCGSLSKARSPLIVLGIIASIASGGIILGEAVVFGNLIQLLNEDAQASNFLSRADLFCLLFFILSLVALVAYSSSGAMFGIVSAHFIAKVQDLSLRNILRQDMQWFSGKSVTSLMTAMTSDAGQLSCLSGVAIGTIFTVTTSVCGGIILAHIVAWRIAVVLLAAVPVMVLSGYVRLRVLALSETRHRSAYNDAASIAAESCRAIRTVASLGRERGVLKAYKEALAKPYKSGLRFSLFSNTLLAFSFSITYFVYALAYWWGAKNVRNGEYTQLEFFIVLPALLFSAQSAGQIFSLSPEIARASTAARNVFTLHDEQPTIISDGHISQHAISSLESVSTTSETKEDFEGSGHIHFENVSLAYPSKPKHPALDNVTFAIPSGESVALVGPSGAGKSTIISLLGRFYDPTSGRVLMDGQDIRKARVADHRARLGLVPQDPDLFPGSVSHNIGLGAASGQKVNDEDIQNVCKKCGIHNFIMSLPEGYNTECGVNGSKLSGGQKQRIAIARALIRAPEVLLLDEYTSALDAHSEQDIKKAIAAASVGRTTIVVAHRLSTVQDVDRIYVFDQGKVVEMGRHSELVARGGMYASMVKAQTLT